MAVRSAIRLLSFRPLDTPSTIDGDIRTAVAGGHLRAAGQRHLIVGRRGSGLDARRVLISVWDSPGAMEAWAGGTDAVPERTLIMGIADCTLEVRSLTVEFEAGRANPPSVLRIFRGVVRDGDLETYVEEARAGTLADHEAGHGPTALYLAVAMPNRFLTVSLWVDWPSIEAATGGDIRRPVATRHADRLTEGTAEHYEIVSDIAAPPPGRVSA